MKKVFYFVLLLVSTVVFSQSNAITYQAVIYMPGGQNAPGVNVTNVPMSNKNICLQFSFVDASNRLEYQEEVKVKTDEFGMVNITVGQGTQTGGYASNFGSIIWTATAQKNLQVSLDATGLCSRFEELSNEPIASVPFANAAIVAGNVTGIVALVNGGTGATTAPAARANLGIGNVDNTSDLSKPISNATKTYVDTAIAGATIVDADATTKGKLQLAGDLAGTAAAPTVPGLALKENAANKSTTTTLGNSNQLFPTQNAVKTYVDTAIAGATIVDADATTKGKLQLAGDLAGTAAAPTVPGLALKENIANKSTDIVADAASTTKYPSVKVIKDYVDSLNAAAGVADGSITSAKIADATIVNADVAANAQIDFNKLNIQKSNILGLGIVKGDLGLGNVDNTSDAAKPVSTATQTALNLKANAVDLAAEVTRATAAETTLTTNLAAEVTRATAAEATLTTNVTANATAITAETTRATAAEATLTTNLAAEVTRATAAETTLTTNVTANSTAIAAEVTRATAAETTLTTNLAAEVTRATAAEATLTTNVTANATAITAETTRATAAETTLTNNLAAEVTRATAAEALKAPLASPTFTGTVSGITQTMVGLSNVDNTSDANKPVSIATTAALALKENAANKSLATDLGNNTPSDDLFPSQKAVKTYVDASVSSGAPDATTAIKGKIQLAGDLTGTADLPTIATGVVTSTKILDGTIVSVDIADNTITGDKLNSNLYAVGKTFTFKDLLIGAGTTFGRIATDGTKHIAFEPTFNVESTRFWGNGNITIQTGGTFTDNGYKLEVNGTTKFGGNATISGTVTASSGITGTQFTSTIATGTAPFVVTSTTPVANLNIGGNAATVTTNANLTGMVTSVGNATTVVTNADLTGEVTSTGNATTVTNAAVIGKVLTGYTAGAGTVAATDTILQALQKIDGNDALKAPLASPTFTGTPTLPTGTIGVTQSAGDNTTALATTAFVTTANTTNANLTGMVTSVGNATTVVTNADLTGDVTSSGNATTIGASKVVSSMIADGTIVATDIATDAIEEAKIKNSAVTTDKIAAANVTEAKLANNAVTTDKITNGNVTTAKLADNAVETAKIRNANVTNEKLDKANIPLSGFGPATADVALGGKKLTGVADPSSDQDAATKKYVDGLNAAAGVADGSITSLKIADATIVNDDISTTAAIVYSKLNLANSIVAADITSDAVETAKIKDAAVTSAKILDGTIATADIATAAITYAKIQNVAADKVLGRVSANAGVVEEIATTGTGDVVRATSPTLVTPNLGTPSAAVLTSATGLPLTTGVTGILPGANGGTGVNNGTKTITLGGNLTTSGAFATTLTATAATTVTLPTTGTLATLDGTETLTNKTLTSPTMTSPTLGVATATSINGLTPTALATGFTIAGGTASKTLTVSGDATVSGTNTGDQTTITGNAGTATKLATARKINTVDFDGSTDITVTAAAGTLTGTTLNSTVTTSSLTSVGTLTDLTVTNPIAGSITGNAATVTNGIYTTSKISDLAATTSAELAGKISDETGSGTLVFATSPTLVTPNLGTPSAVVLTSATGLPLTTGVTGILPIANGGTGSSTKNFVDLTSDQTIAGVKTFSGSSTVVNQNLTVNAAGTSGQGIILSDDGDIVDNNDGAATFRFAGGVKINNGNKSAGTTTAITLANTGNITATGSISGTQLTSTVATGTAPFVVTSTTPVANLNIGGNAATVTNGIYTTSKISDLAATTSAELAGKISDETGSGTLVFATSPTLVTPVLGVATATSVNGTTIPSSKTLVVTTDKLNVMAATTSAELAGVVSDETGTGAFVLSTSPTLVTPTLGAATATSVNKLTITTPANGSTLTIADGKTLTSSNTITLAGTDATTMTFPGTSATIARTDAAQTFTGVQTFSSTIAGSINGNAATATKLETTRKINTVNFDGSADITVTAAAGTLTGDTLASNVLSSSLTSVGTITTGTWNGTTIAIANGGTGSTTQNFVDLTTAQTVAGAKTFSGNTSIGGTLAVTGATTLNGNTSVSGANTLTVGTGATALGGTLAVTGATTLNGNTSISGSNTLTVGTGATALGGTLAVTGATTLNGNTSVSGSNTLTVGTGATTLGGTLGVTGNTTVGGTLAVTGATTLSSTLGVTGNTTLSGTLAVTGATTLSSTLGVTGDVAVNTSKFKITASSGNTEIAGTLKIAGGSPGDGKLLVSDASGLASWNSNPNTALTTVTTATYPVVAADKYVIYSNAAAGTITLPDATSSGVGKGKEFIIKNITSFGVIVNTTSSQKIVVDSANSAATTATLGVEASNNWIRVISDGTQWIAFRALF